MIVALHVATGAATGALTRSRLAAVALVPPVHLASDRVPHRHPHWVCDLMLGGAGLANVATRRGLSDPTTIGALAAVASDLKHVLPPRRQGRLRRRRKQRGLPVSAQLALAAALLARSPPRPNSGITLGCR